MIFDYSDESEGKFIFIRQIYRTIIINIQIYQREILFQSCFYLVSPDKVVQNYDQSSYRWQ